ncbi:uncharacterized protein [Procambarus clarkii]|uniref:uncharacterized protein n=1 Tax=Procambarus clarkii TaxID=6728 RepID=UPI0037449245
MCMEFLGLPGTTSQNLAPSERQGEQWHIEAPVWLEAFYVCHRPEQEPRKDENKPDECSVCFNNYDGDLRPRCLPCGHTFCSQCVDSGIKNGQLTCPNCRAQHIATAAAQYPINYGMEAFIRRLKGSLLVSGDTVAANPYNALTRGISKKLRSLVEEQKSSISSLITSCEEVLSQLVEYRDQLGDWKTHHLQLQDRLYGLVEKNKAAMKLVEQEDTCVVDMTTQGEKGKSQLEAMLGSLDTVKTAQEAVTTIDTADQCHVEVEDWLQKCQELFPDVNTVHTSVKVQETITEALEMVTTEAGVTVHLEDSASTIIEKVQKMTEGVSLTQIHQAASEDDLEQQQLHDSLIISSTDLPDEQQARRVLILGELEEVPSGSLSGSAFGQSLLQLQSRLRLFLNRHLMTNTVASYRAALVEPLQLAFDIDVISAPFRKLSRALFHLRPAHEPPEVSWSLDRDERTHEEAGRVFAVQEDQDDCRFARITFQDGQLYLHPLLHHPTPTHAHTLQESEVVGMLDSSCTLAFLDLGWAGSTKGRVTIRLTPDTPLAKQFVLLCTGQRGPSYLNTKLLWVRAKGRPRECVYGGDYESNDGRGGAPLLPHMEGQYPESGRAGAVCCRWLGSVRSAQFAITTKDRQDGHQYSGVFGEVVSGLDVVRAAVNHSDVTEVTVVDCGVVLPL